MTMLKAGDAQSLINMFKTKQIEDPMFFYTVQVDQDNRMTNFLWRDGKSKTDFDCFGDIVMFDTTYRTNKYNMICAPFVGVNQHWKNVLFGCAFLLDETTASFIWLFETFLEAMEGKKPKTIFIDRCQAMANAIEKVFPESRHRLCLWHISKNATHNISCLLQKSDFGELFRKFLFGCVTTDEFESTWNEIITKFTPSGSTWLETLYELRENGVHYSVKTHSLLEYYLHKEAEKMRSSELEETFRCNNGIPSKAAKSSGFKKQPGMVYTRKIYNLFESEFIASLAVKWEEVGSDGTVQKFELNEEGHKRVYTVQFNFDNMTVSCSCQMYESMGWLCRHALRVLNVKHITKIPAQYILKRWTKDAKKGVETNIMQQQVKMKSTVTLCRNSLIRKAYGIINKGAETSNGSDIALQMLMVAEELIEKYMEKLSLEGDVNERINKGSDPNTSSGSANKDEIPFQSVSFPLTNVYTPYTLYNENPTSMLPFPALNLTYPNMHQNPSARIATTNLNSQIPQHSQRTQMRRGYWGRAMVYEEEEEGDEAEDEEEDAAYKIIMKKASTIKDIRQEKEERKEEREQDAFTR
ncbi:protein FAR1-RELATED SEQUENCE 3-like [Argentina anserina]|uniref:protein FAR1-RELATED SEQUENCE 3-like n=1 Tax=Argentina anserina TaxID=57926 RepID=UPI0021766B11|nr:protein FAR1-RELATED SEQUENCE 3-like [Potentilla anserina]